MYPQRELNRIAAHKAALRRGVARRRAQCAAAASRLAQPFELLDRVLSLWRRLSSLGLLAAVPLAFLASRAVSPRRKLLRALLRWGPLVFRVGHGLYTARTSSRDCRPLRPARRPEPAEEAIFSSPP